ncbi:hypothetical protein Nmel_005389 [Mimus melanotis]
MGTSLSAADDLEPAVKMSSDVGLLLRPKGDSNLLGRWRKSWRGEMRRKRCKFNHVSMMMSWQQATAPPRGLLSETCVRTEFSKLPGARHCVPPPWEAICSPPPAPSAGLRARQPGWKALLLLACPGSPRPSC